MDNATQPVPAMEQDQGDEYSKANVKQALSEGLGEFQEIVAMPKQMILITLISKEPAIFNPKHNDYRNPLRRDSLWNQIAKRVGWTDKYCKNKWKAMRDQYCRELKRSRTNPKVIIKWKYFQHLDFLRPYALYRKTGSHFSYRPKMSTRSKPEKDLKMVQIQLYEPQQEEAPSIKEDKLCSIPKTENLDTSIYNSSTQANESSDITLQIMEQIAQGVNNDEMDEELQDDDDDDEDDDDEDDDPIHTFLNIESYFEKELISMIQSADVLYNFKHPLYRNAKYKLSVWEEIARKLKKTVRQCRLKWKALRDQYIREHKRLLFISTVHGKDMPRWKHYDALGFLENFTRTKSSPKCDFIEKPELGICLEPEEDHEMTQYIMQNDDRSEMFANCGRTRQSGAEEEQPEYIESREEIRPEYLRNGDENRSDCMQTEKTAEEVVTAVKEDTDEVGAFFRAIAIKIRKANMSDVAFTELQIDILKVINTALRDH